MADVLVTCGSCRSHVEVSAEAVVLHVSLTPGPEGELLFRCPNCQVADVLPVTGDVLTLLLLVGVRPLALSEPTLDACDQPPVGPQLEWQDLLDWHQELGGVGSVEPWE